MGYTTKELFVKIILYKNDTIGGGTFFVNTKPTCLTHLSGEGRISDHCERAAGYGTTHLYEGRCKFHGYTTEEFTIKDGRYARVTSHQLNEKLQKVMEDPDLLNMNPDLQLLRAMLAMYIERNSMEMSEGNIRTTRELIRDISALIDKIRSIEERHVLTVTAARLMMLRAIEIAKKYVSPESLKSFVQEWKQNTLPKEHSVSFADQIIDVPVSPEQIKVIRGTQK